MKRALCMIILILAIVNITSAQTKLRVGYVPATGFLEEDSHGHYRGYGYEYMEFLARYGNWQFEYVPSTTWQECNVRLQAGEIDVLPAMPGDYRTLQNVTRTDHVIGRYPMTLITKDGKIKPNMRIGTIASNAPIPSLPKVAASEGFSYELVNYNLFYDMEESFNRNEIDGYIAPMFEPNNPKYANAVSIFDRQSYRLLVRTDRKDLLDAMNIAMDEMLMDQPNIRNRLNDKYLRRGGSPLMLNKQEKDYLAQKKKLTAAILMKDKPYVYEVNGKLRGVIPRLIQQISEDLDIEIEIMDTKTPIETAQLMQSGKIDFIADVVCNFSWAKDINMAPTQSYLQMEYVLVSRRGNEITDKSIIACDSDLIYAQSYIMSNYSNDRRLFFKDMKECFQAVSDGKADFLYAPRSEVSYFIEDTNSYNLEMASESDFSDELSLGVYIGADSRLWRILNKEVNHLDLNKINNVVNEDINATSQNLNPQWLIYHYPIRAMLIMFLIAILIAVAVWYRIKIRRQHMNTIHNIAYTDARYNLPNLIWLKKEIPKYYEQFVDTKGYIVFFGADRSIINNLPYDRELRNRQVKNMAEQLHKLDWVLLTSTGEVEGSLICLCKNNNDSDITRLVKDIVHKYSYLETEDSRIWLHMKAGICNININDISQTIENAKAARHKAQDVMMFNSNLQDELTLEQRIEHTMYDALKNEEFQAWYQQEYDIETHKQIGAEAFVRWQSSELGFLLPDKFIPVFERNGFIISIDYFVLEEVCKLQRGRLNAGKNVVPISTNQSHLHLFEESYLRNMKSIIKKYKLPKNIIKLEFQETAFNSLLSLEQRSRITNIISELRKLGFKVSIDHFGAGNSSYSMLNYLSVDEVKIHRSILYSSIDSDRTRSILESIINLSKRLNLKVICEGIETKAQEKLLLELGCHYGQGFLNDESRPDSEFLTL